MERTYVFDNNESCGGGMAGIISALCNKQGIDPAYILGMMNNQNGMNGGFGWFWIIILLIFGWGGFGGNGFGNNGGGLGYLGNLVNNDAGRELLMNAINGNANAIGQLASTLNCDVNALQGTLNTIQQTLCNVGNQVGLTSTQVINAIQAGNASIASQLASCCCDVRQEIANFRGDVALQNCQNTNALTNAINFVNSSVERGFASNEYNQQAQTNAITQAIANQTTFINDKFCQLEMREMQNKIDSLRLENQSLKFAESQAAQNNYLISQLQPVAKPAYLTCSPYQAAYGFNPYGYFGNNGCCGNNNSGCGF